MRNAQPLELHVLDLMALFCCCHGARRKHVCVFANPPLVFLRFLFLFLFFLFFFFFSCSCFFFVPSRYCSSYLPSLSLPFLFPSFVVQLRCSTTKQTRTLFVSFLCEAMAFLFCVCVCVVHAPRRAMVCELVVSNQHVRLSMNFIVDGTVRERRIA